jgi:hypothetical protein
MGWSEGLRVSCITKRSQWTAVQDSFNLTEKGREALGVQLLSMLNEET